MPWINILSFRSQNPLLSRDGFRNQTNGCMVFGDRPRIANLLWSFFPFFPVRLLSKSSSAGAPPETPPLAFVGILEIFYPIGQPRPLAPSSRERVCFCFLLLPLTGPPVPVVFPPPGHSKKASRRFRADLNLQNLSPLLRRESLIFLPGELYFVRGFLRFSIPLVPFPILV